MCILQGRRNDFWMGGGGKKIWNHTFFQKDTILFISISVISNIHWAINIFYPYFYTLIYMSLFL